MGFNDILRNKDRIFNQLQTSEIFIRPSNGYKSFAGQLIGKSNFEENLHILGQSYGGINDGELVLLSEKQPIQEEYRFIVVNQVVISGSLYSDIHNNSTHTAYYDKLCEDKEIISFVEKMAKIYSPDVAFTLDVCKLKNGDLKVIEINSCCCAGWYGADKKKNIDALSEAAIKEFNEINQY
jgi:hypothetical protein